MTARKPSTVPHANLIDLTGQTFGRWVVLERKARTKGEKPLWSCRCACGATGLVDGASLRNNESRSCGCLRRERAAECLRQLRTGKIIHGHARKGQHSKEYDCWQAMLRRCDDPSNSHYYLYGGRGIRVSEELKSFESFFRILGPQPRGRMTVDRKDSNGDYTADNVQWADRKTQSRNLRTNRLLTLNGETKCLAEWAETIGVSPEVLHGRLGKLGWSVERSLTEPLHLHSRK